MSARAKLILHMNIPKTRSLHGYQHFWSSCDLDFDLFLEIFYLADNFWPVNARAMIFDMSISNENPFPLLPTFLSLWPWRCSLTYFLENFNFANDFLTLRVIFFIFYINTVFHLIRSLCGYLTFWLLHLTFFWQINVSH